MESNKIKILYLVPKLVVGGMELGAIRLINNLDRDRFSASLCSLSDANENIFKFIDDKTTKVHALQTNNQHPLITIFKLSRLLVKENIDIIHPQNQWASFYAIISGKLINKIVVITQHGFEENIEKISRFSSVSKKIFFSRADKLIVVCKAMENKLVDLWKIPNFKITYIPNGVDLDKFVLKWNPKEIRKRYQIADDEFVIGTIGRLRPVKDHITLIESFAKVQKEISKSKLVIVGNGDMLSELKQRSSELGIRKKVVFAGESTNVEEVLSIFDIFVNSSIFEGMSYTIIEAMASGKAIIATRVGGNPELIIDGENGFLVEPQNPSAMTEKIIYLLTNELERKRIEENNRTKVKNHHNITATVQANEEIYKALWAKKNHNKKRAIRFNLS